MITAWSAYSIPQQLNASMRQWIEDILQKTMKQSRVPETLLLKRFCIFLSFFDNSHSFFLTYFDIPENCQVMLIKNIDVQSGLVNGSKGSFYFLIKYIFF